MSGDVLELNVYAGLLLYFFDFLKLMFGLLLLLGSCLVFCILLLCWLVVVGVGIQPTGL